MCMREARFNLGLVQCPLLGDGSLGDGSLGDWSYGHMKHSAPVAIYLNSLFLVLRSDLVPSPYSLAVVIVS